ncbi:helix-turn-helix domain-containing protein [Saccharopolyspora hattusasensis]|uniref:helix-turn-helix domain-containing protein n=1 Tax=Saccharopolyspora hattusasensis TaxID=1128679 RepID=UPI003D95FFE5
MSDPHARLQDMPLLPEEAADLLHIPVEQLLADAYRGDIPGVCLGGQWRFSRRRLQRLVTAA